MVERDEVSSIERQMRELTDSTMHSTRERSVLENIVLRARETLERAKIELPIAERNAKERRQSQVDAIRGRAELERRLNDLIEAEGLARSRRQQAEQRAQGFKAAAAFASMARVEADSARDAARAERERVVEERAGREGTNADARASEERAEEARVGKLRAEVAGHVKAEREIEGAIASEREAFENQVAALRTDIERAGAELHEAEVGLARLEADRDRLSSERTQADDRLREVSERARADIEARIADLRAAETNLARERAEQERLLATLIENEKHAERERKAAERAESKRAESERATAKAQNEREAERATARVTPVAPAAEVAEPQRAQPGGVQAKSASTEAPHPPSNGARNVVAPSSGGVLDFAALGNYSDAAIQAEVDAQDDLQSAKPAAKKPKTERAASKKSDAFVADPDDSEAVTMYKQSLAASEAKRSHVDPEMDEQLIPGFRSFIGNIFTRTKSARSDEPEAMPEEAPDDTSIADRIARDFGLLGSESTPSYEPPPAPERPS